MCCHRLKTSSISQMTRYYLEYHLAQAAVASLADEFDSFHHW
jgi:hypothetical protein